MSSTTVVHSGTAICQKDSKDAAKTLVANKTPTKNDKASVGQLAQNPPVADAKAVQKTSEMRQWRDSTGEFSTTARVLNVSATHVALVKADGQEISVPKERLSQADREFVSKLNQVSHLVSK